MQCIAWQSDQKLEVRGCFGQGGSQVMAITMAGTRAVCALHISSVNKTRAGGAEEHTRCRYLGEQLQFQLWGRKAEPRGHEQPPLRVTRGTCGPCGCPSSGLCCAESARGQKPPGSFVRGPFLEAPARAALLLFSYCTKTKLF